MKPIDAFYLKQEEPIQSCMMALRAIILKQDQNITTQLKYGLPFFCYKDKMFCYLWYHNKYRKPYIGFVEGHRFEETYLLQEKRKRMKIMLINSDEDLPIQNLNHILKQALDLYRNGIIRVKE
ncbi:DUF1801 domain-containing protein [Pedobacter alpinus]|uniref:DUF1801 domain-containing protein n=1 Tax=Pedobacter alpinus TaxID=1590643 RepID=A0ABW5TND0_9SPHI